MEEAYMRPRTSGEQYLRLVKFMERHGDIVKLQTPDGRVHASRLWNELADILNACGPRRSPLQWKKKWIDWKCKARIKAGKIRRFTGGNCLTKLTKLEQRVVTVCGGMPRYLETEEYGYAKEDSSSSLLPDENLVETVLLDDEQHTSDQIEPGPSHSEDSIHDSDQDQNVIQIPSSEHVDSSTPKGIRIRKATDFERDDIVTKLRLKQLYEKRKRSGSETRINLQNIQESYKKYRIAPESLKKICTSNGNLPEKIIFLRKSDISDKEVSPANGVDLDEDPTKTDDLTTNGQSEPVIEFVDAYQNNRIDISGTENDRLDISGIENSRLEGKSATDDVDNFFLCYARSFKKLSVPQQIDIKLKMAQLFAEAELKDYNSESSKS